MSDALKPPVRFAPSMEHEEPDEAQTGAGLDAEFRKINETTSADYGYAVRAVHAKSHGVFEGELTVAAGLRPDLAQGLFADPGTYKALMRISTNPGDLLDDAISVPRGFAIKLFGVEGARLPGSEGDTTQDFVMANGPAFAAADPRQFLGALKPLAATTDRAEGGKKALSAVLQAVDGVLSTVGIESALVRQHGGAPQVHPLGETYWAQTPFLFGDHVAKLQLVPVSGNLTQLTGTKVNTKDRPNALREDVAETMVEAEAVWELRVQLLRDPDTQPIEDASKPWDEKVSPFETVATLRAPAQVGWSQERARPVDDCMSFSPWHGLAAHRPLGAVNRVRRLAYKRSADFRGEVNGCPMHEPREPVALPR